MSVTHYKFLRLFASVLFVLAVVMLFVYRNEINLNAIENRLSAHPVLAPLIFMVFYSLLIPLFFPSTILALLGGALFGPVWGSLFNQVSVTLGASLCFVIARAISTKWLEKNLPGSLRRLKHGVEKEGWRFVLMVRLVPWMPYAVVSYALGATHIRLSVLIGITAACILPRVIAYSYIGYAGRMALSGKETVVHVLLVTPLVLAAIFLPYLVVHLRTNLKQYLEKKK